MTRTDANGAALPLDGIKVLDVASFIAAPIAATVLADYGADVVKVEPPGDGDPNRHIMHLSASYPKSTVNYPWLLDSRGKRSLAIDLKNAAARAAFDKLIASADILIVNYPPKVREKLLMRYEDVAPVNPRLIYASFTGYGETGPDADQVGFDANAYFARSGLADGCRYEGVFPGLPMPAQGDRGSGLALAMGIMMALWNRERTGKGTKVSSSLLANGIWANGNFVQGALLGATLPLRPPPDRPRSALANVYETKDHRWIQMTVVKEDQNFPDLVRELDLPQLARDSRFTDTTLRRKNSTALAAILRDALSEHDFETVRAKLKRAAVPFSEIQTAMDVAGDAQAVHAGAVVETDIPEMPKTLAPPFSLADAPLPKAQRAPALGAHSVEVLREAGVGEAAIEALQEAKAIEVPAGS
ncbi:MAG: CoA transferase [Hyphomicrobiales bacterium]|nr:MAG: CoA transferase [Hyphomicrobiales bacterium]